MTVRCLTNKSLQAAHLCNFHLNQSVALSVNLSQSKCRYKSEGQFIQRCCDTGNQSVDSESQTNDLAEDATTHLSHYTRLVTSSKSKTVSGRNSFNIFKSSNIRQSLINIASENISAKLFQRHSGRVFSPYIQFHTGSQNWLQPKAADKWKAGTIVQLDVTDSVNVQDFEDRLVNYLCDPDGRIKIAKFKQALTSTGLRETDPRLQECMRALAQYQSQARIDEGSDGLSINKEDFKLCITKNIVLIAKAFRNQLILPDFNSFCKQIDDIYWKGRENISGHVASYIPQLTRYSPNLWGVSVCTVDGQRYSLGDTNVPFCLQSISKPLTYAMVMDELSPKVVHEYVGHEPSGTSFNSISLNYNDKPHNPMINAGAIVVCSLLKQEYNLSDRFDHALQMMKRLTGGEYVAFNNSVFLSERETADRNFALGYYMREKKCFPNGTNLMEVLDFYFQMCSIEVTCESGSVIAATLANGGICPITGDKVLSAPAIRDTLSLMHSCGMYDYSGEFAFKVGLPSKSGVAGGIMLIVPNKMGFFMWSPALDKWGNSVRGVQFSQDLVSIFNFHHYDNLKFTPKKIDPCRQKVETRAIEVVNLLFSAFNSDISALRRFALHDVDMDQADYDGRTALHIGAAEGHANVVQFLLNKCKCSPHVVDRWGFTPLDDAKRFGHEKVAKILVDAMEVYNSNERIDRRFQAIDSTKYGEVAFSRFKEEDFDTREVNVEKGDKASVISDIKDFSNELLNDKQDDRKK